MAAERYTFALIDGHPVGLRAIGFLEETVVEGGGKSRIDAKSAFDALNPKKDRELRTRFDHWLSGAPPNDRWYHRWPSDYDVKECICFKWDEKRRHHRLYGFICHPQPKTNARFQLCTLAYHDVKNDESTDRNLLLRSVKLQTNVMVRMVISLRFPDERIKETTIQ